jgi:hypothetical protein
MSFSSFCREIQILSYFSLCHKKEHFCFSTLHFVYFLKLSFLTELFWLWEFKSRGTLSAKFEIYVHQIIIFRGIR